jgi:hypothetical protein
VRALLCVLAFGVTSVVVYRIGSRGPGRKTTYQAAATVHQQFGSTDSIENGVTDAPSPPAAGRLKQQLLSEHTLRRALGGLTAQASGLASELDDMVLWAQQHVVFNVQNAGPGRFRIFIHATGSQPELLVELVNGLARHYMDEHHIKREATARQSYLEAKSAADAARQNVERAVRRLNAFLQEQSDKPRKAPREVTAATPVDIVPPSLITALPNAPELPESRERDSAREDLIQRRAALLVDRTPQHPEVQQVDALIAELDRRSAAAQDDPPNPEDRLAHAPVGTSQAPVRQSPTSPVRAASVRDAQIHQGLNDALEHARFEYRQRAHAEQQTWRQYRRVPEVWFDPAEWAEVARSEQRSPRVLLLSLTAGLAMFMGLGMMQLGGGGTVSFATVDEVRSTLPVSVLGVAPVAGDGKERSADIARQCFAGRAITASGLLLMGSSLTVVVHALAAWR